MKSALVTTAERCTRSNYLWLTAIACLTVVQWTDRHMYDNNSRTLHCSNWPSCVWWSLDDMLCQCVWLVFIVICVLLFLYLFVFYYVLHLGCELHNNNKCRPISKRTKHNLIILLCVIYMYVYCHRRPGVSRWQLFCRTYCCTSPDSEWLVFIECLLHIQLQQWLALPVRK